MWSTLLQKARNKHFLSLVGNGIMSGLGMLTMVILYRSLSVTDIGLWVFFLSTLLFVDTFRSGFITTAFIKFYAGADPKRSTEVAGSAWMVALGITGGLVLLDAVACLFIQYIDDLSLLLFIKWFSLAFIVSLPTFMASCVVQAEQRFDRLLILRLVTQGSNITLLAVLLFLHAASVQSVLYAYVASTLIASIFSLVMGWARVGSILSRTPDCMRELFHFGKYSVGTTLSANLFGTSNTFIINFMLGAEALAIFNLGQRLMELVEIPLRSFAATGMPELAAAYNQGNKAHVISTMKKYIGLITLALIPACLVMVLLADVTIVLIGGSKYADTAAATILRIQMLFALLYPLDRFMALTLDAIHQPRVNFIKVLFMLVGSVSASLLAVFLTHDILGVAAGGIVPILIGIGVSKWALDRYLRFQFVDIYKEGFAQGIQLIYEQLPSRFSR